MPFPRLEPTTVEGEVRSFFRMLSDDDRLLLSSDPQTWDPATVDAFIDLRRRLYSRLLHGTRLLSGNTELLEDVRTRNPNATMPLIAAQDLFLRLAERAQLERNYYPPTVSHAEIILKAELSESEYRWLMCEPLTEHGLLMHQLVTWCMRRFGLEGENTPLIEELTGKLRADGDAYHPWHAARYIIQHVVLAALATMPELAEAVIRREIETSLEHRNNPKPRE